MAFKLFSSKKSGTKFDFELDSFQVSHPSLDGKLVTVRWSRGSKKTGSLRNVVADSSGKAVWKEDESLEIPATLFRSEASRPFDAKEIKLNVDEVVKAGSTKSLGSMKLDLAKHVDASMRMSQANLDLVFDHGSVTGGRLKLIVRSAPSGDPQTPLKLKSENGHSTGGRSGSPSRATSVSSRKDAEEERSSLDDNSQLMLDSNSALSLPSPKQPEASPKKERVTKSPDIEKERMPAKSVSPEVTAASGKKLKTWLSSGDELIPASSRKANASNALPFPPRMDANAESTPVLGTMHKIPSAGELRNSNSSPSEARSSHEIADEDEVLRTRKVVQKIDSKESMETMLENTRQDRQELLAIEREKRIARNQDLVMKREKEAAAQAVAHALSIVEEHEAALSDLSETLEREAWEADVAILLEAAIHCMPLPNGLSSPSHVRSASQDGSATETQSEDDNSSLGKQNDQRSESENSTKPDPEMQQLVAVEGCSAWVVARFMLHWGLLRAGDNGKSLPVRQEFFRRLLAAVEASAERCDPCSKWGRWLLTNVTLLESLIRTYAHAASAKTAEAERESMLALADGLARTQNHFFGRIVESECALLRKSAIKILETCGLGTSGDVGKAAREVEEDLEALKGRTEGVLLLPWLRRGIAKAVFSFMDALFFDKLATDPRLCTFESAVSLKTALGRIERWGRKPDPTRKNGSFSQWAAGAALSLPLTRQACDVLMMEKFMLVGGESKDFREQICPDLSIRRIYVLVASFCPSPTAPHAVPVSVIEELRGKAEDERGPLLVSSEAAYQEMMAVVPSATVDEKEILQVNASQLGNHATLHPLLRNRDSFLFLHQR